MSIPLAVGGGSEAVGRSQMAIGPGRDGREVSRTTLERRSIL
jgi:hypothetical protein